MASRLKVAGQVLAVALVASLLALLAWKLARQNGAEAAGRAPNFALSRLDGTGRVELASLRGKVVVVNFWASWCFPCKKEAPALEGAWRHWRNRGVVVVGIDVNDFKSKARKFVRRHEITYPVVRDDRDAKTYGRYRLTGLPETFVVDRRGKIVEHVTGQVTREMLDRTIRSALS
jgi:cytochrome c biogenesis protein CcmG, thiol:disulfide interchange protein DsbE